MLRRFVEIFLSIPAPLAIGVVFLLTAGETAFFLGLFVPGELTVILGGVLASQARVSLVGVLLAGVIGPIVGDSAGYFFLGRRYARLFLKGRRKRWAKARAGLRRRGAFAVFLGRFTAFLRSVVPAAAGAARLPYRRFFPWECRGRVAVGRRFGPARLFSPGATTRSSPAARLMSAWRWPRSPSPGGLSISSAAAPGACGAPRGAPVERETAGRVLYQI